MQLHEDCKDLPMRKRLGNRKSFPLLNFLFRLLLAPILLLNSTASGQGRIPTFTFSFDHAPLEKVLKEIERQGPARFIYSKAAMEQSIPVTISVIKSPLEKVLTLCFNGQPLVYESDSGFYIIRMKKESVGPLQVDLTGKVISESGEPISGATVQVAGTSRATATTQDGTFDFTDVSAGAFITVTGTDVEKTTTPLNGKTFILVRAARRINQLDETIVMGYGSTTRRKGTGNIAKIGSEAIGIQPVSNVLDALHGRVAGLIVTQSSGVNGAGVKLQLRGQNSILQGSEPFYIIDGVPFAPNNNRINQISNATAAGGLSPFSLLNPSDIASIEVLKDADATAIYGSRGSNGVILITTKKGQNGKNVLSFNNSIGFSRVARKLNILNTEQYRAMRKEGFRNEGVLPVASSSGSGFAPDITLWDSTQSTDIQKMLIGNTAKTYTGQLSYSGGDAFTQFLISGSYNSVGSVLPIDLSDKRSSALLSFQHRSKDSRVELGVRVNYSNSNNQLTVSDLTSFLRLPPNIQLHDSTGALAWRQNGITFRSLALSNPLALLNQRYTGVFQNLNSNLTVQYRLLPGLLFKGSIGYNTIEGNEKTKAPVSSLDPNSTQLPYAIFSNSSLKSWIVEPQIDYSKKIGHSKISALVGATWQENNNQSITVNAQNYSSDILLGSIAGAGSVNTSNSFSQYRYNAFFGRVTYNLSDKYIVNFSGRRDGSSRFGPATRFANFGAAGLAWIFSSEHFIRQSLPFLSFGKLRASYGVTGNDQIPDYRYLATWTASSTTYQGISSLNPSSLYNPDYAWEQNRKLEAALELGFWKDRIFLSAAWFENRCGNQLISYNLPIQTGFASIGKNLDALVRNSGLELQLSTINIRSDDWNWTSTANISFQRNKLISFPGLSTSSYATTYVIGSPLSARYQLEFVGVDAATGIYKFTDADHNNVYDNTDRIKLVNTDPSFFGGLQQHLSYKNVGLDIGFEFRKQTGLNYLLSLRVPGYGYVNQPALVLDRWQKPGDNASIQRFTALASSAAYAAGSSQLLNSDAIYSDATFIRWKTCAISWSLPPVLLQKWKLSALRLYVQVQNLLTITGYKGADPENQNLFALPPLRTIATGIQINL